MPKLKRKRASEEESNIIGGRDVHKIQRLMRQNADQEEIKSIPQSVPKASDGSSSEEEKDDECVHDFQLDAPNEELGEIGEDFEKFFNKTNDSEFVEQVQRNILDAKLKVNDELSQFSGSIPGELNDLAAIDDLEDLPEELRNHIRLLVDVLKHYRSGPLPKTIKMLPHLPGWEGLLELLQPLEWTPHVYPRVVKVFASKGHQPALHFYENCLLPKVKSDIQENRRLSVQLFEALIASMFRPEEFVSGLFLPWVQSEMSKTEGVILSHLMRKASLKVRYAAVALALTLEEEFSIPRSFVIESLLSKRYHLPEAALTRAVQYFISFDKDCSFHFTAEGRMPVTWFKCLLTFLESYRGSVTSEERKQLVKLCRRHEHPQITPEIRNLLALIATTD